MRQRVHQKWEKKISCDRQFDAMKLFAIATVVQLFMIGLMFGNLH